jgi:uncharacterized protein (TIGR02118 family)
MLKRFVLNRRKPDLSAEEFGRHWRESHGPLLTGLPEYRDFVSRYDQNHVLAPGPVGTPFGYDGLTEIWQRSEANVERRFSDTELYREIVLPDELKFADREQTVAFFADQLLEIGAQTRIKLIVLTARRAGLAAMEFHERLTNLQEQLQQVPEFRDMAKGYQHNCVRASSGRGLAGTAMRVPDDISAFWFTSLNEAQAACRAVGPLLYRDPQTFATEMTQSFFAEAINFFDQRTGT